jgi:PAS domain S-box-containing protein
MTSDLDVLRQIGDHLVDPEISVHIIENSPDAIVIVDKAGEIIYINLTAELWFSYPRVELYGKSLSALVPERFHALHGEAFRDFIEHPRVRALENTINTIAATKDGIELNVAIMLMPVVTASGLFVVATIRKR